MKDFKTNSPLVKKAYLVSGSAHSGVKRLSGEPYIIHPIAVMRMLQKWGIEDENLLAAALTHDVLEDSDITYEDLSKYLNNSVADLVDGVSKLKSRTGKGDDFKSLRKVILKSYLDPRVAVLKLADRVHNMETIKFHKISKRKEKSTESIDVYAKLAESLGMWLVKTKLEDISFANLKPRSYERIKREVDDDSRLDHHFLIHWKSAFKAILDECNIDGNVEMRRNGYWALMKKRERASLKGKADMNSFSEINDLVSIRITVPSLLDCYRVIGQIHSRFGELVDFDRYDEFLGANSRENGYSALQTTMILKEGALEVAVATVQMEEFNLWGVVSLIGRGEPNLEKYVLKLVFTPNGEVRFLPKEATAIDYAYLINPRLGADSTGVMIDGEYSPMSTVLPNASTVEILVGEPKRAPDTSYLKYALSSTQRMIKDQLILQKRDVLIKRGKKKIEPVLSEIGILGFEDLGNKLSRLLYWYGSQSSEDLYFKIGRNSISVNDIRNWFKDEKITKKTLGWTSLRITGNDQPGILEILTSWIHDLGGNIIDVAVRSEKEKYTIQIVIDGLNNKTEAKLIEKLHASSKFKLAKVV